MGYGVANFPRNHTIPKVSSNGELGCLVSPQGYHTLPKVSLEGCLRGLGVVTSQRVCQTLPKVSPEGCLCGMGVPCLPTR